MDFPEISQLKNKKFWWMDMIFYFVLSLLFATVITYVLLLTKDNFQRQDILTLSLQIAASGTSQQREYENTVKDYQKKISDFSNLFKNHEFTSNVLAFIQAQTLSNIWFKQFSLDEKNNTVALSGEADNMDAFSKQIALFERNKYVKSLGNLSSSIEASTKISFNFNLVLDQSIFNYVATTSAIIPVVQQTQPTPSVAPTPVANVNASPKLITSFNILLNPAIIGTIDETNFLVTVNVPFGTNVTRLTPQIMVSPGASVAPASDFPEDFSKPVIYTVTGQEGSTQDYKVTVNVMPAQK